MCPPETEIDLTAPVVPTPIAQAIQTAPASALSAGHAGTATAPICLEGDYDDCGPSMLGLIDLDPSPAKPHTLLPQRTATRATTTTMAAEPAATDSSDDELDEAMEKQAAD